MSMLSIPLDPPGRRRHAIVLMARLRRFLNRRIVAAIAASERQADRHVPHPTEHSNHRRLYHSPIDHVLQRAARSRMRKRSKP